MSSRKLLTLLRPRGGGPVPPPTGFGWTPPISVYKSGSTYTTNLDMGTYEVTGTGVYYVATDGDDGNPGTEAQPFGSVAKAVSMPGADTVLVAPGLYDYGKGWYVSGVAKSMNIKANGGAVTISQSVPQADLSWVAESAPNADVYKATWATLTMKNVRDAANLDSSGDFSLLTERASVAAVQANPGSYYINCSDVYVRTTDSRAPDSDIWVFFNANAPACRNDNNVYIEGINFYGGADAFRTFGASSTRVVAAKDCSFKYSTGNGLECAGGGLVICENCVAAANVTDGFHMQTDNTRTPNLVLVDCIGRGNYGSTVSNGISSHADSTGHVLTVNTECYNNAGPNHADIGGCLTWCIAENCHDAAHDNFWIADGTMWCDTCVASNPGVSYFNYKASPTFVLYIRGCTGTESTSGTVTEY